MWCERRGRRTRISRAAATVAVVFAVLPRPSHAAPSEVEQLIAVTEFPIPANAYGITLGPDGNLWFTEQQAGKIGRFVPP